MTKEVVVSIKGLQIEGEADGELIETISFGEYYKKGQEHYVVYDEVSEESGETTENIIECNSTEVRITKKGMVNTHMVFGEAKKNISSYQTLFGELLFGIDTQKIVIDEKEEQIRIQVEYTLELNYEFLADCSIVMDIRPRTEGGTMITS